MQCMNGGPREREATGYVWRRILIIGIGSRNHDGWQVPKSAACRPECRTADGAVPVQRLEPERASVSV